MGAVPEGWGWMQPGEAMPKDYVHVFSPNREVIVSLPYTKDEQATEAAAEQIVDILARHFGTVEHERILSGNPSKDIVYLVSDAKEAGQVMSIRRRMESPGDESLRSQGEEQMGKNIEDRIRDMYAGFHSGKGNLGLGFDGPASPEEAKAMLENGMVRGGMMEGTDAWLINPINRFKGPIELEVESSLAKGEVMAESLSGQFEAWVRQGAKDLHNGIVPAFPESHRGVDEMGTPMVPTSAMVTRDVEPSREAADYARETDAEFDALVKQYSGRGRDDDRGMERE